MSTTALQKAQKAHDASAHQDIFHQSPQSSFKHFAHHFAKYAGRVENARLSNDSGEKMKATLVDTTLITLSLANLFAYDLSEKADLSHLLQYPQDTTALKNLLDIKNNDPYAYFCSVVVLASGKFAKVADALDHMEPCDHQALMEPTAKLLFEACEVFAAAYGWDLTTEVALKHHYIKANKVY